MQVLLNNGSHIPQLGFGTWQLQDGEQAYNAVRYALELGYRLIDTAHIYQNEASVGRAIRDSGIDRSELFVTTKLFNTQHVNPRASIAGSLAALGLDYLDLYLIHWPVPKLRGRTWQKFEEFVSQGKTRSIGVSNYTVRHLDELLAAAAVVPAINQIELHPFLHQREVSDYCHAKGIAVEAYSPLMRGQRLDDGVVGDIARKHARSSAQILIRWSLQLGNVVIPRSSRQEHIRENFEVFDFELSEQDMASLSGRRETFRTGFDPSEVP